MAEKRSGIDLGGVIWGMVVVFVGVVVLLQSTGVLPWALWGTLWRFWPVVIILLGVGVLLRRHTWLVVGIVAVVLGTEVTVAVLRSGTLAPASEFTQQRDAFPAAGIQSAETRVDFRTGTLRIAGGTEDASALAEVRDARAFPSRGEKVRSLSADFREEDGVASLNLKPVNLEFWDEWRVLWELRFNRGIPLELDVRADGSRLELELQELNVKTLRLVMNVSSGTVTLPARAGDMTVDIDMDVSNLEIIVPEGVAVRIEPDINVSTFEIDRARFQRLGDSYASPEYDTAPNRIRISILCDVGRVVVR